MTDSSRETYYYLEQTVRLEGVPNIPKIALSEEK